MAMVMMLVMMLMVPVRLVMLGGVSGAALQTECRRTK